MRSSFKTRGRSVRGMVAVGAAVAVLALVGCSSKEVAPEVAGAEGAGKGKPQDDNATRKAWVDCMHKQGQTSVEQDKDGNITFPASGTDSGVAAGFDTASRLCDEKVPGIHQVKQADDTKYVEMARKWVACARKNGYADMPDPDPKDRGTVVIPRAKFDEAKWDAVSKACEAQFPLPGYRIGE